MPFYPRSATNQRAHTPTLSPSVDFTFGLVVESIKELGGASLALIFIATFVNILGTSSKTFTQGDIS
jgi:hypothetical protein